MIENAHHSDKHRSWWIQQFLSCQGDNATVPVKQHKLLVSEIRIFHSFEGYNWYYFGQIRHERMAQLQSRNEAFVDCIQSYVLFRMCSQWIYEYAGIWLCKEEALPSSTRSPFDWTRWAWWIPNTRHRSRIRRMNVSMKWLWLMTECQ